MNINLDSLGGVTRTVGSPGFGQALFKFFNDAFDIRFCSVFAFPAACAPRVVISEGATTGDSERARSAASDYVNGGYRDDPKLAGRGAGTGLYHMPVEDIDAASGCSAREPRISCQLVQLSALDGVLYRLSLYRDERAGSFHAKDVIAMRRLGRFAVPAVRRHIDLAAASIAELHDEPAHALRPAAHFDTPEMRAHLRQVFLETSHGLSPREAEVCASIVLGYSTNAIGLDLQIACNTVATHRKRAYKKLGVCSQSELFARYFANVSCTQAAA